MKARLYYVMDFLKIVEVEYSQVGSKKPSHVYQSPDVTIHVYGTFKESRLRRDQLDYQVMLAMQEKGLRVGQMYHE